MEKKQRYLENKQIWQYSFGFFGLMLILTTFNTFSYNYIIYVIGLDEALASYGIFIGLIFMAIGGPLFGYISDNTESKWGRRRPFILFGVPIMVFFFIGLWLFPIKCSYSGEENWGVAIYYWIFCGSFCLVYQSVWAPYMAMLPEISEVQENRIKISSAQGLFNLIATVIGILLPFILISGVDDPKTQLFYLTEGGKILITSMLGVSIIFAALSAVALYTTFFTISEVSKESSKSEDMKDTQKLSETNRNNPNIEKTKIQEYEKLPVKKMRIGEFFKDILSPLNNRDMAMWSATNFIVNFGMRLPMTILLALLTFVLDLDGKEMILFILMILPFTIGGFFLWQKLADKFGLKTCYKVVIILVVVAMLSSAILLTQLEKLARIIIGFIIIVIIVSALVAMFILPNPITSEIIDAEIIHLEENSTEKDNFNRYKVAGKFFGVNSLTLHLSGAISFLLLGFMLDEGGSKDYFTIVLLLPVTGIIIFFSLFTMRKVELFSERKATTIGTIIEICLLIITPIVGVIVLAFYVL